MVIRGNSSLLEANAGSFAGLITPGADWHFPFSLGMDGNHLQVWNFQLLLLCDGTKGQICHSLGTNHMKLFYLLSHLQRVAGLCLGKPAGIRWLL